MTVTPASRAQRGGEGGGGGVVAVDVEGAGVDDPVAVEIGGLEDEAFVAAAEDGAFAFGVDEDEGLGAGLRRGR